MTVIDRAAAALTDTPRRWLQAAVAALAVAVVVAVVVLAALLTSPTPASRSFADMDACKEALRAEYHAAIVAGVQGTRPAECNGIDDATIGRLAGEVISEEAGR